jgi:hypothetical protein
VDVGGEGREIVGGKVEGRHAGGGDAGLDDGAELIGGLSGKMGIAFEAGALGGTASVVSVTSGAVGAEELGAIGGVKLEGEENKEVHGWGKYTTGGLSVTCSRFL